MKNDSPQPKNPAPTLASLAGISLNDRHRTLLETCAASTAGPPEWRYRKVAEATDLLRLSQLSGRIRVLGLDLTTELRAELLVKVTVPCLRTPDGPLEIAPLARLGLVYREEALRAPQPGYSFVQILEPRPVWHPHVSPDAFQVICLGAHITPGFPARELILLSYMALAMVAIRLDAKDSAGLLNHAACEWWQRNTELLPLSAEPFVMEGEPHL